MITTGPELDIAGLGAQGDGIAKTDAGPRFAAFALPGERVRVAGEGLPELVSAASPDRIAPLCLHFGTCGGCAAQHMSERLYADWKRSTIVEAFRQRGLEPEIGPLWRIAAGSRRRAMLTSRREGDRIVLGYHRRKSHDLVDIGECPVLAPAIVAQLPALRAMAAAMPERELRFTVLSTPAGLDVAVRRGGGQVKAAMIAALGRIAIEHRFARIAVDGEVVVERAAPTLSHGGIDAVPPPGAFVQAVEEAEVEMIRIVLAGVGKPRRVADLFCGLGTFALPLARLARVLAVDGDGEALAALSSAAKRARGLKPIETKVRDLFREPLSAKELEGCDAVVFDPPRAGARAQAEQLARSSVQAVVAISCDAGTLARDARILADGGYAIERVTPIDQFLFSSRVEAVAVLKRTRLAQAGDASPFPVLTGRGLG